MNSAELNIQGETCLINLPSQTTPEEVLQMENSTTRNKTQARNIESWILNQIALRGATNIAKLLGVHKSTVTTWKENLIPRMSMLLAALEWGIADDDMARLAKEVATILRNEAAPKCSQHFEA